ncbi:MAG: Panacea domain-containing protein [Mucilaginibacter sp.]
MYFPSNATVYTKDQLAKLGNAIIFLADRINPLSKTKLLKLIYLIEELSVKKYGAPFFNVRFDVWKLGPVSRDLYVEITSEPDLLEAYIIKEERSGGIYVKPKKEFSDEEFNDLEIALLEDVVKAYGKYTADQLIELTHRKHSPWYVTAQKNGLLEHFENDLANTSDVEIDLSYLIEQDAQKLALFKGHKDFLEHSKRLKF